MQLAPITVLVGHAGVGKTNVALGLALAEAAAGREVTLADLDIVNPYFRSSDYPELLREAGVRLVAPVLARTTLDTPSLSGELDAVIAQVVADPERRLIMDVGGDDDGATAIGRWSRPLGEAQAAGKLRVLYVVSAFRALTISPEDAAALLPGIEEHARLRADAILNTSNLGDETTAEHVRRGIAFAQEVAELCDLPLEATIVPEVALRGSGTDADDGSPQDILSISSDVLVMSRHVRLPWD